MLRVTEDDGVRTLTLDRPDRLNAVTAGMFADLRQAVANCARDPGVRAVVLTGAGRGFCAGFDLGGDAGDAPPDPIEARWRDEPIWSSTEHVAARLVEDSDVLVNLHGMGKPTIASVRGPAAGTGLLLAAACDIRIASETAVFKTAFISAGRCGDPGGAYLLTKILGPARARALFMLDERVSAIDALAMGLVTKVVPDDQLEAETTAVARRFAEGPGMAYAALKRNLNLAETATLEQTMTVEAPFNVMASTSHDGKEAARAFMEKRKPVFRGY
jgi:2-(1,2-epoxy-1,2-dihydrophenyl)acetyl-CoA isomerase